MAKLDRNRHMLFASWTGSAISESATATCSGDGITAVTVTAATFGTKVNKASGAYTFTHDGTNWTLRDTQVSLADYGLVVTGEAEESDQITVQYIAASGGWEALGKDNDDLSKELNPDTETSKNVLGESTFSHSGYEPEVSVDPYYADPARLLYAHLKDIAEQEKSSEEECMGYMAEAHFTEANAQRRIMTGYAYVRQAWIVPVSIGGDTSGLAIPFTVHPVGGMTKKAITYDMATNQATITDWTED